MDPTTFGRKIGVDENDENSDQRLLNAQIATWRYSICGIASFASRISFRTACERRMSFTSDSPEISWAKKDVREAGELVTVLPFTYFAKKDGGRLAIFTLLEMIDQHEHYQTLVRGKDGEAVEKHDMLSEFPRLKFRRGDEDSSS